MKRMGTWMIVAVTNFWPAIAFTQLQVVPQDQPQRVFAGTPQQISIVWRNPGSQNMKTNMRARILQANSATVVQVDEVPWKKIQVLPHQTVLESAQLDFPAVKAKTKFLVQWLENSNHVVGTTAVWVYPTNLLAELNPLLGQATLGVLDLHNELKPLLRQNGIKFVDLSQMALEDFSGKLAILGPFHTRTQFPEDIAKRIKKAATNGVAILWLQPQVGQREKLLPSFYPVSIGTNIIIVAQANLVANLSKNPQSQQHLVQLCQQALRPEPLPLPGTEDEP